MQTDDFIVIGAGSAGCAVAGRLSQDPQTRVLLLEAGPEDRNPWIHVPVGYYRTIVDSRIGWGYETAAVPGSNGRTMPRPRRKVLDGLPSHQHLPHGAGPVRSCSVVIQRDAPTMRAVSLEAPAPGTHRHMETARNTS
jgi:hypothetical protein